MEKIILPSITTTRREEGTWRDFVPEIADLCINKIALFLTCLDEEGRDECYRLLGPLVKTMGLTIPFVHARADMRIDEFNFLINEYGTQRFNLHPMRQHPLKEKLGSKLRELIYIENSGGFQAGDPLGFGGICIDFAHLEAIRRYYPDDYSSSTEVIEKFPIGAAHISAAPKEYYRWEEETNQYCCDVHFLEDYSDLDYLNNYPKHYFSGFIAIELTNPLKEQLRIIEKVKQLIGADGSPDTTK